MYRKHRLEKIGEKNADTKWLRNEVTMVIKKVKDDEEDKGV